MTKHNSETTPDPRANASPVIAPARIHRIGHTPIRILLSEGSSLSARQTIPR